LNPVIPFRTHGLPLNLPPVQDHPSLPLRFSSNSKKNLSYTRSFNLYFGTFPTSTATISMPCLCCLPFLCFAPAPPPPTVFHPRCPQYTPFFLRVQSQSPPLSQECFCLWKNPRLTYTSHCNSFFLPSRFFPRIPSLGTFFSFSCTKKPSIEKRQTLVGSPTTCVTYYLFPSQSQAPFY